MMLEQFVKEVQEDEKNIYKNKILARRGQN
jgi:hypothetical protein